MSLAAALRATRSIRWRGPGLYSRGLSEGGNEPNRNERNFIMARTSNAAVTEPKTPAFQAWHVTNKGDDSFWTKVGAAWPHRDGKGLSLILSVIPMNGQIVLREPRLRD